jgi:uncharacterized protein with von Willebrand factor type A (vWA) domain
MPKRNQFTSHGQLLIKPMRWHTATWKGIEQIARTDKAENPTEWLRQTIERILSRRGFLSNKPEAVRKRAQRARAQSIATWEKSAGIPATGAAIKEHLRQARAARKAVAQ